MIRSNLTVSRRTMLALGGVALGVTALEGAAQGAPAEKSERHPNIRAAVHALRRAAADLKEAAHDFGGHRKEALADVERAINQLELCLKSDK